MEWNAKWDWENFVGFGPKSVESPKKLHAADLMLVDDGEIHAGSFNLSGDAGNSNPSASDGGHGSPAKSSISATTDSSTKDRFRAFEGSSGNFGKKVEIKETEVSKTSPLPESSLGSVESLIGLKLGKRTYFENSSGGGNVKSTSFSEIPPPKSTTTIKKTKSSGQSGPTPHCQVEGCDLDLSMAKEYHRKHRVCDNHSKSTKVIVGGVERRFCQQCSRFHSLSEFDDKKRSCRRRLSDHNARRRKPHQETIHFNSSRFSSPFYGGSQQMNFQLNNSPLVHSRAPPNSVWNSSCDSKFTLTREYPSKFFLDGASDKQLRIPVAKLPHVMNMHTAANLVSPFKNSMSEVLNPGSEGSLVSSVDAAAAAPEYRRALSLLSSHSWDSCEPESIGVTQPMMQDVAIPEGVPLSSDFWLTGQHSAHQPRLQSLSTNSNFQEIQLFRTPSYEADFYSNMLN